MICGIVSQQEDTPSEVPPEELTAVRFDNSATPNGITRTATTADSALLTISLWFKFASTADQYQIVAFKDFDDYIGVNVFGAGDIVGSFNNGAFTKYLQFGSSASAFTAGTWNHLFVSVDANHGSGAKLYNMLLNGSDVIDPIHTQDIDTAFSLPFNGQPFGIPSSSDSLGSGGVLSIAFAWVAPGVYVDPVDVTMFRDIGGNPVDLGANGETPTGSSPAYYFKGDASTFATNLGTGGSVTLVGSMDSVTGPP